MNRNLPKPILFGIYGALGCLIGALLLGEPIWRLLAPPTQNPELRIAVSPSVEVEQGGATKFMVKVARSNFEGPVVIRWSQMPDGVHIPDTKVPAGNIDREVIVNADDRAQPLNKDIELKVEGSASHLNVTALTEMTLRIKPTEKPLVKVDVLLLMDVTGSMQWAIDGVKNGIQSFLQDLEKQNLDAQIGIIAYRDDFFNEKAQILNVNGATFTKDFRQLASQVATLVADGGGDEPESTLDAFCLGAQQKFRSEATKVIFAVTDASPHIPDQHVRSMEEAIDILKKAEINQVHMAVHQQHYPIYRPLVSAFGGQLFDIQSVATGVTSFESILPKISKEIARIAIASQPPVIVKKAHDIPIIPTIQSNERFQATSPYRLLFSIGCWTATLALGIALFLIAAQNRVLRRSKISVSPFLMAALSAIAAGMLAGALGQLLFMVAAGTMHDNAGTSFAGGVSRIFSWTLLGWVLGYGMGFFIPNLSRKRAGLGGAIGGAMGALAFLFAANAASAFVGRMFGALILGFFIGLMVALVEHLAREAALIVHWGPQEKTVLSLGEKPILLGSSPEAHIYLPKEKGFPPVAALITFKNGKIEMENKMTSSTHPLHHGNKLQMGDLTVEVSAAK